MQSLAVVFQLLGPVFFVTPRTAACQASQSFTISQSLLKLMFIESVMACNHLVLCTTQWCRKNLHEVDCHRF